MPYVKQDKSTPQMDLLDKYETFHLAYQYESKTRNWRFVGYTCTQCHRTVQNPNIVPKHYNNCDYKGPTVYLQEPDPNQILNKKGDVWKPFDVSIRKVSKHG